MKAIAYVSSIIIGGIIYSFLKPYLGYGALAIAVVIAFILEPIIEHTILGALGKSSDEDSKKKRKPYVAVEEDKDLIEKVEGKTTTKPIVLFGDEKSGYTIDPATHKVDNPERGLEKYLSEGIAASARQLGLAIATSIGLVIFGYLFYSKVLFPEDGNPLYPIYNTFGTIVGFLGAPIAFISFAKNAIMAFGIAQSVPDIKTAEGTLKTFFSAIKLSLWSRAYNCLTDTAQNTTTAKFPRKGYLQQKMTAVIKIDSLDSFKIFWSKLPFSFQPLWDSVQSDPIDEQTTKVHLRLRATWSIPKGDGQEQRSEDYDFPFLLVKRNGYWFLCNGFIWSLGPKDYSTFTTSTVPQQNIEETDNQKQIDQRKPIWKNGKFVYEDESTDDQSNGAA